MAKHKKTIAAKGEAALLIEVEGRSEPSRFVDSCSIGRAPDNDLVIDQPSVSMQHARASYEEGAWWLKDLGSTNGTILHGQRIESVRVEGALRVRLGYEGPSLVLRPEAADVGVHLETVPPSESDIRRRYFSRLAPENMGTHTAELRRVFFDVQRKKTRRFLAAFGVLALVSLVAGSYAYVLRKEVAKQKAAAADLFYEAKLLELQLSHAGLASGGYYEDRHAELERRYLDYLEELGIYGKGTPEEVQLIYRIAHRFGESEVNVPPEFVEEVRRYIRYWQSDDGRLSEAMLRAEQHGYGARVAEIMLENDMPPEFFYLALQESDLRLEAVGPSTRYGIAKGMWQFIPGTAREYGLRTGPLVGVRRSDRLDDRHNFEKATIAAAKYLRRLYTTDAQASGLLVIATYNWGQGNLLPLIRSLPETPKERNFWNLLTRYRERIPKETSDYVFKIVSAAVIGENPELFGFDFEAPLSQPETLIQAAAETPDEEPAAAP